MRLVQSDAAYARDRVAHPTHRARLFIHDLDYRKPVAALRAVTSAAAGFSWGALAGLIWHIPSKPLFKAFL